jgi:hypothetical protein
MAAASDNKNNSIYLSGIGDTKIDTKSVIRAPRFELHDAKNLENQVILNGAVRTKYITDVYDDKEYKYSLSKKSFTILFKGGEQITTFTRSYITYREVNVGNSAAKLKLTVFKKLGGDPITIRSYLHQPNVGRIRELVFSFSKSKNNTLLLKKDGLEKFNPGVPILSLHENQMNITVEDIQTLFGDYKDQKLDITSQNQKAFKSTNERRLVLFINSDIPELDLFLGYITETSKYTAPYMYNTGIGYWINIGPIYGTIDINDVGNNFYLSYERDYQSGNLVNELIRTSFMPFLEAPQTGEYQMTGFGNVLWYVRYYNPVSSYNSSGNELITQEEYMKYKKEKADELSKYLPKVLSGLLKY